MCQKYQKLLRYALCMLLAPVLALAASGCASDKPQTLPVTPKASYEVRPCDEKSGGPSYADAGYQSGQSGQHLAVSQEGWSQTEKDAANFIQSAPIYFHYDSFALTGEAKAVLRQKAERIKAFPQFMVTVAGYCDERGTANYNFSLGGRRALAAADYLASLGVSRAQLHTISFGKSNPTPPGQGEAAWSRNRRDDFHVSKP